MRTEDFWAVVDRARAGSPELPARVAERAVAELVARPPEEIQAWGRHLDKVLGASFVEDLWAAAYLVNGGCSDDGFDSFRGWLVGHGRETFARAVRTPDSLADLPAVRAAATTGAECDGPEILGIAADAYRAATGAELDAAPRTRRFGAADLWDLDDEDEMRRRLPRLAALFLEPPLG